MVETYEIVLYFSLIIGVFLGLGLFGALYIFGLYYLSKIVSIQFIKKRKPVKIVMPKELQQKDGRINNYHKYEKRRKYTREQCKYYIKGKKVKYWLCVYSGFNPYGDLFVPVFYKR